MIFYSTLHSREYEVTATLNLDMFSGSLGTSIRQYIVEISGINNLEVSYVGKSKTTIQFIAISLAIIAPGLGVYLSILSITFLWLASLISVISLYKYLVTWNKFFN